MMSGDTDRVGVSRRNFLSAVGGAGTLAIAGCTSQGDSGNGNGGGLSGSISISGSSTVYPLMTAMANDFKAMHDGVNPNTSRTGSGGGFSNHFCLGNSDFNNASRPITQSEKELCQENGVEWHEIRLATDALTVIVNNDNDWAECLTVDELRQIWKEDPAETWSDVNSSWPDQPIKRFGAADTSGTFDYFKEVVLGEDTAHTTDYDDTEKDNLILSGVQQDPNAIGYFGFAYYQGNEDSVKALGIDDGSGCVKPSIQNAKDGSYQPLSRPLFTYVAKSALAEEHIAEFARFVIEESTNEQLVANQIGFVPNTKETKEQELSALNDVIDSV